MLLKDEIVYDVTKDYIIKNINNFRNQEIVDFVKGLNISLNMFNSIHAQDTLYHKAIYKKFKKLKLTDFDSTVCVKILLYISTYENAR